MKFMNNARIQPKPARRATLNDIARHAGVTVGTVSGVLQNKAKERRISDEVVQRVLRIAHEVDYAPNLLVRSLHRGNTQVLSFLNGFRNRDRRDYYMDALTASIEQAGGELGYNILVLCDFSHTAEESYKYINGGITDGLIFFKPRDSDPLLPYLRRSNLPIVLLNSIDGEGLLSSVTEDWRSGIGEIAQKLITLGHRRVAAFTANGLADASNRLCCLRQLLGDRGVEMLDSQITAVDGKDSTAVNLALRNLMSQPQPPTALFCWHDYVGYRVLEECHQLGIDVPNQLSVVGYDGVRWPARTTHILASVEVDIESMSKASIELLVELVRGDANAPIQRIMPVRFQEGTTLGPAID
jgi:LacI family transcriptional regulator